MPQNKSHHYVPQMFMRLFAREGDSRIGVFVIDRRKFIPGTPIRGQACRDYFYGVRRSSVLPGVLRSPS